MKTRLIHSVVGMYKLKMIHYRKFELLNNFYLIIFKREYFFTPVPLYVMSRSCVSVEYFLFEIILLIDYCKY